MENLAHKTERRAYRIAEVARAMAIGKSTLYKVMAAGKGPRVVKLGSATLVLKEDFDDWRRKLRA
jgi:excisionase family DNA binding protein